MKRALIAVAATLLLQGCGFEPLYADTSATGSGVSTTLSTIFVEPISDRIGYELRNDLLDRLDTTSSVTNARYRLRLNITELEEPVVFQPNTSITRYNYTLTAHYDLVARDDAQPVKSGDITAFAAYNVAASPYLYSTVAAQRDAKNRAANDIAERIRIELAVYLRQVAQQTR
jgi:LPS-assembly lipoprotein